MTTLHSSIRASRRPTSAVRIRTIALAALALAAPLASHAGYSVSGNTIAWTADGWYQVQRPATSEWDLCNSDKNPGRSCTVPNGTYTVINHTSGTRADNIPVPQITTTTGSFGGATSTGGSNPGGFSCNTSWNFLNGKPAGYDANCKPASGLSNRAYIPSSFKGGGTVSRGTPGKDFSIDWTNTGINGSDAHTEFDISIGRDIVTAGIFRPVNERMGFGYKTVNDVINRGSTMTAKGIWEKGKVTGTDGKGANGKSHIQNIIWLTRDQDKDWNYGTCNTSNRLANGSIDITVAQWMQPKMRENYRVMNSYVAGGTTRVGTGDSLFQSNGSAYRVYRRPGGICEKVSYLVIRTANAFDNASIKSASLNVGALFTWIIGHEVQLGDGNLPFDENWFVSSLGWEMTGASKDGDPDVTLGNSSGKFRFSCYSIPGIDGVTRVGPGFDACI